MAFDDRQITESVAIRGERGSYNMIAEFNANKSECSYPG